MKRLENNLPDLSSIDPGVAATLRGFEDSRAARNMPRNERKRQQREQAKSKARSGKRATYDIDPQISDALKRLASAKRTSASGLAALAIARLLDDIESGQLDLRLHLQPISNPNYDFLVVIQKAGEEN